MSQPASQQEDLEEGSLRVPHDRLDPQSTSSQPLHGESNFGDSSGPFFSIYSRAADDEDNKMVDRWQKDADGILIFTGLFSAAVAALLSFTVQFLIPNSQDTSAFYLGNIYEVLADPNATRTSILSPVAKPPPFSPPRYAIWVNSLWFLSLVISLTCALLATSLHQWSRRYIRVTQLARCSQEKRARMRTFFADGADKMHIPWAVEGLPVLLHLSVFLFFGGLTIFLFNIDRAVFSSVIWWIVFFSIVYGLITVMPIVWHDSPYYAPLSRSAWSLYAGMNYVLFKFRASKPLGSNNTIESWRRFLTLKHRYQNWMLCGVEKAAEDTVSERSSEIDIRIFDWTLGVLGDDDSLEKFFDTIPGFFSSKLVKNLESDFPEEILNKFWSALDKFMKRTLSSNSVTETVKTRRVNIRKDIMSMIPCHFRFRYDTLYGFLDQAPVSIERLQAMTRWRTHTDGYLANCALVRVAKKLASMQERDDDWIALATEVCDPAAHDLAAHDLRDNIAYAGDNVLLAILIYVSRRTLRSFEFWLVGALAQFDIRHTLPVLQRNFCTLWNELVQEARKQGTYSTPIAILRQIRHLHIALHQGTDATRTTFPPGRSDLYLYHLSAYPLCYVASHRPHPTPHVPVPVPTHSVDLPDASPHHSTSDGTISIISGQVKDASINSGSPSPFDLATTSEIGDSSRVPCVLPARTSSRSTDTPPPVLNKSLAYCDAAVTSASNSLLRASSIVGFSIPASPVSNAPPLPNAEFLAITSSTFSRPTGNAALPPLRARGLVNTGSMCFANAVLQLLVHSPPFWNLFRELDDLNGQHGAGGLETDGGATPLVDATLRFFKEFVFKDEPPPTQQPTQQAERRKPREDEEAKEHSSVDSFEPTYIYDAMKEKMQLKKLLDNRQRDAEEFFCLYIDALDEELLALLADHESTITVPRVEEREVSQSGQSDVRIRGFMAISVESPISLIFGGRSRSTVRAPNRPETITVEDWRLLRLNIQPDSVHTIQDALAHLLQPQSPQDSGFEATQQVHFEELPPVLVVHLGCDLTVDDIVKISKPVQFTPELEIPIEIMAPGSGISAEPAHYKLYGVLYHHGKSSGNGHYTVDVLHPNGDSGSGEAWLRIDDEAVSAVRHENVFGIHNNELGDDRCAYMLFYCRTASTSTSTR